MSLARSWSRIAPAWAIMLAVGVAAAGTPAGIAKFDDTPFRFSHPSAAQSEVQSSGPTRATIRNEYQVPTYGEGIAKTVDRLKGKDPLVMSAEDFAINGASLMKTSRPPAPTDGTAQVKFEGNAVLVRVAGHEERVLLKRPPSDSTPADHEDILKAAADRLVKVMYESHERPERVEWSMTTSSYVVVTGDVKIVVSKPDMPTAIDVEAPTRVVGVDGRTLEKPGSTSPAPRALSSPRDVARRRAQPTVN